MRAILLATVLCMAAPAAFAQYASPYPAPAATGTTSFIQPRLHRDNRDAPSRHRHPRRSTNHPTGLRRRMADRITDRLWLTKSKRRNHILRTAARQTSQSRARPCRAIH